MISAGYFTPNEIRVREGFAPLRDDDGRFGTLHWYAAHVGLENAHKPIILLESCGSIVESWDCGCASGAICYTLPEPIRWSRLIIFGTAIALLASALAAYLR